VATLVTALEVCRPTVGSAADLPWSLGTYLGGALEDRVAGIGIDGAGNIHVVGRTTSADFPTVPLLPYAPSPAGLAFVSRFDPTGSNLLSSVVLTAFTYDAANIRAVAVDASGNAYVTGSSWGGLPVVNAAQPLHGGGLDAFVAKIGPTGAIAFSTYLGGGNYDVGTDIAVDPAGGIHVVGLTTSGFPVKNAWFSDPNGSGDVFVVQLDPAGGVEYATYLGGEGIEGGAAVATNASGATWVVAQTRSGGFPITPGAWQSTAPPGPLLHSDDGGGTWTPSAETLRNANVTAIAVDPSDPANVYVGTGSGEIYGSENGGDAWTLLHRTPSAETGVFSLAVDGGEPATIYAGVATNGAAGAVLRSRDGGATWESAGVGLPGNAAAPALVIDPEDPQTVYGVVGAPFGLYRSENGADSWTPIPLPAELPGEFRVMFTDPGAMDQYPRGRLAIDPNDADHLLLAGHQRVAQSFDRGATWTVPAEVFGECGSPCQVCGYLCTDIRAIAIDPSDASIMYVAGTFGFAKTTDGGLHWDRAAGCLDRTAALIVDPVNASTLYGIGAAGLGYRDLVRSFDGGASWEQVGDRLSIDRYNVLALGPGTPARLHAGLTRFGSQSAVTRLDPTGAPVYSTYAGPVGDVVDVDSAGNAFLPALSLDPAGMPRPFPVLSSLDPDFVRSLAVDGGGRVHLFVRNVAAFEFHTSLDPASPDAGVCVPLPDFTYGEIGVSQLAVTPAGDPFVAIVAGAPDLAVPGAYQATYAGEGDAFVARLEPNDGFPLDLCIGSPPTPTTSLPHVSCTLGPTTTTTTTLPPSCGDGVTGAACLLSAFLDTPLCDGEVVGARLQRFVERRGSRALDLLAKASAHEGRKRTRGVRRADRLLRAIQKRAAHGMRTRGIPERCGERIRAAVAAVRDALVTG